MISASRSWRSGAGIKSYGWPALGLFAVLVYAHEYLNPWHPGIPFGLDAGTELAYEVPLESGGAALGTVSWFFVAFNGMPLLLHPNGHLFYWPFSLPLLALGPEIGLRLAYFVSLALAWTSMYALARTLGSGRAVAAWAGVVFAIGGVMGARLYAGHVAKVLSTPLIPAVLACAMLAARQTSTRRVAGWAALAGCLQGLMLIAGEPYLPLYLGLAVPLVLVIATRGVGGARAQLTLVSLVAWIVATLLTASAKLVGSLDLLAAGTRIVDPFDASQDWYWGLVHLVFPLFLYGPTLPGSALPTVDYVGTRPGPNTVGYGWWEYSNYVGLIPVLLAFVSLIAMCVPRLPHATGNSSVIRRSHVFAMLAVALVGFLWLADGSWYSPIHWLYAVVPGLDQFRLPSRALAISGVAVIALGSQGLQLGVSATGRILGARAARTALAAAAVLALADLYSETHWIPTIADGPHIAQAAKFADALLQRDSRPFVLGIGDFQTEWSHVMLEFTRRGIRVAYSLSTLTPAAESEHKVVTPDMRVRYMLVRNSVPGTLPGQWQPIMQDGDLTLLINVKAPEDAWLLDGSTAQPTRVDSSSPTRFTIRASTSQPEALIAPANAFPGWSVSIDGGAPEQAAARDGYIAVETAVGQHTYDFAYAPPRAGVIVVLGVLGWALSLGLAVWALRQFRHPAPLPASAYSPDFSPRLVASP